MKQAKEKLKGHKDHQSCNFGLTKFNLTKRSKEFVDAVNAASGKSRGKPHKTTTTTSTSTTTTNGGGTEVGSSVILCDFDGQVVSGTMWNVSGTITCEPSGLTIDEQEIVLNELKNVYAPYDVLVTTDHSLYSAANPLKRMRIIFTESWEWYGQAGGVAFINSMFWGDNTPCFVFTSLLGYNVRYIWAAGAHEAGHTVGLRHQSVYNSSCVLTQTYNPGNGLESPIMGLGYYLPPKWWVGPSNVCCTCIQDDHQILAGKLGLG